jgi:putative transposase
MPDPLYSTDLSDTAWRLIARLLPAARAGGRPRTTNLRAVLNAIFFYMLRTGCQWRLQPQEFPPWGTVYHYFRNWKNVGVWSRLRRTMYERVRKHAGRSGCPSAVITEASR